MGESFSAVLKLGVLVEDLVERLTNGNVAAVKIVLTSVIVALAVYQLVLIAVGYGKLKLPFLEPKPASTSHRAVGDTIVTLALIVATMCLSYFGFEDDMEYVGRADEPSALPHIVSAVALLAMLTLKIVVVRWWHSMGRFLPLIGLSVFALFVATFMTSAGLYLFGG